MVKKRLETEELSRVEGEGLREMYQTVKRVASKLIFGDNSLPENVNKFLKQNGEAKLINGSINRKAISSMINKVLNVLSWGQFQDNLDKTPYDKLFHLSLNIRLSNGKIIKIEKNARIEITQMHSIENTANDMSVSLPSITLNEFVNNGYKQMKEKFFIYDAQKSNCQDFLIGLLRGSNALTSEIEEFIKQKTDKIFENMPQTQSMMNRITDLAGKLDIIVNGGNIPSHIKTYPQFASYYYQNISKQKGISYQQMLKSQEFKKAYNDFKVAKNNK